MDAPNTVTAAQIRDRALAPAMDAVALNLEQAALLHRPETPEADSLRELLDAAARETTLAGVRRVLRQMHDLAERIDAANDMERACEHNVTGWADRLARDLRAAELTGAAPLAGKRLASEIMRLLDLMEAGDGLDAGLALADLVRIIEAVPCQTLFSSTVTHTLGARRAKTLEGIVKRRSAMLAEVAA